MACLLQRVQLGGIPPSGRDLRARLGPPGGRASGDGIRRPNGVSRLLMIHGALKNPYAVVIGALTVLLLGAVALTRIPTDILPTFKTPALQVLTLYPGMPAEVMERDVTSRLERWTGQSNGM